jgi:hypothetical protein
MIGERQLWTEPERQVFQIELGAVMAFPIVAMHPGPLAHPNGGLQGADVRRA